MRTMRFGPFRLDVTSGELRRKGRVVRLGPQPLCLLTVLASRPGELVTREQLCAHLWNDGTSVDFEHGVNTCVRQVRRALGDRPGRARFIETVPRRGYRFIADVVREADVRAAAPTAGARHIVGRDAILADLRSAWRDSTGQRQGRVVCVSGEPGIGKTSVAAAFVATVSTDADLRALVGQGRCSERLAGTEAYLPWLEALEALTASDTDGETDRLLRTVAPAWYEPVTDSRITPGGRGALQSQEQLKRELVAFLRATSSCRPVLLWFEDLHWADASTVDLIAYVADRLDGMSLVLLTTFRETELLLTGHPFAALQLELQARGRAMHVPLPLLAPGDVQAYLDAELPGHDLPESVAALIHRRTEGNPLFVVDSVDYLRSTRVIVSTDTGWTLAGPMSRLDHELPASTRAMIDRKLGLLDESALALLRAASVQGVEVLTSVVADATARDAATVERALAALARVHRIVEAGEERCLPDSSRSVVYRFVHVLYQNVLYDQLPPTERAALSLRSGEALSARHTDADGALAASLARLFEAGGDVRRACDQYLVAAHRALQLFANHEAVALGRAALALLPQIRDDAERTGRDLQIQMTLATALMALRGWAAEEVGGHFARAQELCERSPDQRAVVIPILGLSAVHMVRGRFSEGSRLIEGVLPLVDASGDTLLRMRAIGDQGVFFLVTGSFRDARRSLEASVALYDPADQERVIRLFGMFTPAIAMSYIGLLGHLDGTPRPAEEWMQRAFDAAAPVHPFTASTVTAVSAVAAAAIANDVTTAARHADATVAIAEQHGFVGQVAFGSYFQGWVQAVTGAYDAGVSLMQRAELTLLAIGNDIFRSSRLLLLAEAHRRHGALDLAREALDSAEAFMEERDERVAEAEIHRLHGALAMAAGDRERALRRWHQARQVARHQGAVVFERRAAAALGGLDDPDRSPGRRQNGLPA